VSDLDVARLRAIAGTEDVEVVTDAVEVVVVGYDSREDLKPKAIIRIRGHYLVETVDDPDDWYMGALTNSTIECWGRYGTLETAIRSL
jgi:hypothetical protein